MGYYISVGPSSENTTPMPDEDGDELDRWLEEDNKRFAYSERLGSEPGVEQFVGNVARDLDLNYLATLQQGWCLDSTTQLNALVLEVSAIEREWRRRGLHQPEAKLEWRTSYEELEWYLSCFRNAIEAARHSGLPLCAG